MVLKKSLLYLFLNMMLVQLAYAQLAPQISYDTPLVFVAGKEIPIISPTNTGGTVYPAKYGSASVFLKYNTPFSLAIDTKDNIYTTNKTTGEISKYNSQGTLLLNLNSGYSQTTGVAIDTDGNIFVSQFLANTVLKYDQNGKLISTISGFNDPYGIAFDSNNNAYVANYLDGNILKIAAGDTIATTYVTGLTTPYGITIDATNTMYVSEQSVGDIIKIDPGTLTQSVYSSGFNGPRHLSKDKFGNIYVADFGNNAIKRINSQGTITTICASVSSPRQSAFDSSGNLFIADFGSNTLRRSNATSYTISDSLPAGLTFNNSNGQITGTPTSITTAKTYIITAYNTNGYATFPLIININPPGKKTSNAPSVTAFLATSISSSNATLNGFTNANGANTTVSFIYGENPELTNPTSVITTSGESISIGTSKVNEQVISGLKPFTRYYYCLKAVNDFGVAVSDIVSFSTLSDVNITDGNLSNSNKVNNLDKDRMIVHQAVSPNGDGKNDFFQIEGLENYPENRVTILNRNGMKVYDVRGYDNLTKFFDGHSNISGGFQQQGTYYYQIEYAVNHENKRKAGYFILKY